MLDQIRQHSTSWIVKVGFGGIALIFVFWGFGAGKLGNGGASYAAKVNGEEISLSEYENVYRSKEREQRAQNRSVSPELDQKFLASQVMDELVEQQLLLQYADEAGIYVSPQELSEEIKKQPYLQDEKTHEFIGRDRYLQFLKDRDIDVGEFEKDVARSLRIQKTQDFIQDSVKVSDEEIRQEFRSRGEKVDLSYVRVDPLTLEASLKDKPVSKTEMDAWEKANPGKVESIYAEQKSARWTTPAKVELFQITLRKPSPESDSKTKEDDAAAAKRRSDRALEMAQTDFKKAADQYSEGAPWEKSGVAREMSRREMPVTVADKVFSMKAGDPPALIETPTAYEIVKVKSLTPEKVTELDETLKKEIVEEQVRQARAKDEVEKVAADLYARVKKGEALDKLAASKGLAVKDTGAFPRRDEIPGMPEATPAMISKAFTLTKPGDVLDLGGEMPPKSGNGYVIAVLKEHATPKDEDFDKQKTWIEFSLRRSKEQAAFNAWKADRLAKAKVEENPRLISS